VGTKSPALTCLESLKRRSASLSPRKGIPNALGASGVEPFGPIGRLGERTATNNQLMKESRGLVRFRVTELDKGRDVWYGGGCYPAIAALSLLPFSPHRL
jgi:hypothetical protein